MILIAGHELYWSAQRFKNSVSLKYGKEELTAHQVDLLSNKLANLLIGLDLKKTDRIAVLCKNCTYSVVTLFGIQKAGMIYVGLNERYAVSELKKILLDCEPKIIIAGFEFREKITECLAGLKFVKRVLGIGWKFKNHGNFLSLIEKSKKKPPLVKVKKKDTMRIQYTSGTTGEPKGVRYSWFQHNERIKNFFLSFENSLGPGDKIVHSAPLTHASGNFLHLFYIKGACSIVCESFDASQLIKIICEENVSYLFLVPTMINRLINAIAKTKYDLGSLRRIFYGASPIPVHLLKKGIGILGPIFRQHYGMTEVPQPVTVLYPHEHVISNISLKKPPIYSCGRPVLNIRLKILDKNGNSTGTENIGEVCIKREGAAYFNYWKNPDLQRKNIKNGWFHTGDIGWLDKQGYLHLSGRKSEVIISGGFNIHPQELENELLNFNEISEVAVLGLPDNDWGEVVAAFIKLDQKKIISKKTIFSHLSKTLASYKKPKLVVFLKSLPRNVNGKIDKRYLKRNWKKLR